MSMPDKHAGKLTTGQAARLCSLKPDTILKWIKRGKLPATRTPGGHHRIAYRDIAALAGASAPGLESALRPLRCWEYLSDRGVIREACKGCVVYRVRAAWCFELLALAGSPGHARQFCQTCCEECAYYQRVLGVTAKVLVISGDEELIAGLREGDGSRLTLCVARNAYEASGLIPTFRPGFVIVDEALTGWRELADCLARDSRAPGLKIVLAASGAYKRSEPQKGIAAVLTKPFGDGEITAVIQGFPVETGTSAR